MNAFGRSRRFRAACYPHQRRPQRRQGPFAPLFASPRNNMSPRPKRSGGSKLTDDADELLGAPAIVGTRRARGNLGQDHAFRFVEIEQLPSGAFLRGTADLPAAQDMLAATPDADAMHFNNAREIPVTHLEALGIF